MIYYISSTGSDSNNGTATGTPWQTLTKASSFAFSAGDQVLFKRGDTFYGSLTISHSGTSGNPVIYGTYGTGSNPIITGFTSVTAWTNQGSNIWQSTNAVSTLPLCAILLIGGTNIPMGRYPKLTATNGGYLTYQSHTSTSITSSDLTGTPNWAGAELVVRTTNWTLDKDIITSQSGGTLNFSSMGVWNDGYGFFFQGDLKCITQQNEWYYNLSTKKLSIYSTSQPTNVQIPTIENLVTISSANYITITGLNFTGANGCAIYDRTNNNNITINNCIFSYIGACAIYTTSNTITIDSNNIDNVNTTAIGMRFSNNAYITNNNISNIGLFHGMRSYIYYGTGYATIELEDTATTTTQYNNIYNSGYTGILFYGDITLIKNNFIDTFCSILDDGGGIYTYSGSGRAPMTSGRITENICINGIGVPYGSPYRFGAAGIYLDEQTCNVETDHNFTMDTYMYGIQYHVAFGNLNFHHNTVYNGSMKQFFTDYANGVDPPTNNVIAYNIFVSKYSGQDGYDFQKCLSFQYGSFGGNDGKIVFANAHSSLDYNYYARPIADNNVIYANDANYTLTAWKTYSGKETHSLGSPQTITTVSDIHTYYNATKTSSVVTLPSPMIDIPGTKYATSITLQPYTGVVLMIDQNPDVPPVETTLKYVKYNNNMVVATNTLITVTN